MLIECIIGMSLDARIDWIKDTNKLQEIYYGLVMKKEYDAMICGSTTMLKASYDENNTTKYSNQTLVVIDSDGKIKNWRIIKRQAWWNSDPIVLCSKKTSEEYLSYMEKEKMKVIISGETKVDIKSAINTLEADYNISRMRIDSGGILLGKMLKEKLVNEITTIVIPQLTGGLSPKSIYVSDDLTSIDEIVDLKLKDIQAIAEDYVILSYEVKKP